MGASNDAMRLVALAGALGVASAQGDPGGTLVSSFISSAEWEVSSFASWTHGLELCFGRSLTSTRGLLPLRAVIPGGHRRQRMG